VRASVGLQREAQKLDADAVLGEHAGAVAARREGRELEHQREVIGQLVGVVHQPGRRVHALEPQQRDAAAAGVAVEVVADVQRAPPARVERLHVLPLEVELGGLAAVTEEAPERLA
jgi:hypothetical protein